jgi:uncharacterized membrane protein YfcA
VCINIFLGYDLAMDVNVIQLLVLFLVGLIAGGLNTLAGGGSFLTVPMLIFTGIEPTVANATNRLGIWFQSLFGVRKFRTMGYFPKKYSYSIVVPAALGAICGAYLATIITDASFKKYFAFFMVLMTLYTLFKPSQKEHKEDVVLDSKMLALNVILYFGMGFYSGFIQAGVGFMIVACCVMSGFDMVRSHSVKMFFNLVTATVSVAIFIYAGKILYMPGLALGVGMSVGAVSAAGFSTKVSNEFLKKFVSVMIIIFAVMLLVLK